MLPELALHRMLIYSDHNNYGAMTFFHRAPYQLQMEKLRYKLFLLEYQLMIQSELGSVRFSLKRLIAFGRTRQKDLSENVFVLQSDVTSK